MLKRKFPIKIFKAQRQAQFFNTTKYSFASGKKNSGDSQNFLAEEENRYFSFDPTHIKDLSQQPLYKLINATTPDEIIAEVVSNNLQQIEEIKFALFYLSTFDLKNAKSTSLEIAKTINFFISKINKIADDNENLIFFLHSMSKFFRSTGLRINLDELSSFLKDDHPNIIYKLFPHDDLVNICVYASILYEQEIFSFIEFFERQLKKIFLQEIQRMSAKNLISFLLVLQGVEYKDLQLLTPLVSRLKSMTDLPLKDKLAAVYLANGAGLYDPEFFESLLNDILTEYKISEKTEEQMQKDDTISAEQKKELSQFFETGRKTFHDLEPTDATAQLTPSDFVEVLTVLARRQSENLDAIKKIYFLILNKIGYLPLSNFIDLWLLTSVICAKNPKFVKEPILSALRIEGLKNPKLSFKAISPSDLTKIIISLSSMKVNDKELVHFLMSILAPNLSLLNIKELVQLFRAFYVYSNILEAFFIEIHNWIVKRANELDEQLIAQLKEPLRLKAAVLKHSSLMMIVGSQTD